MEKVLQIQGIKEASSVLLTEVGSAVLPLCTEQSSEKLFCLLLSCQGTAAGKIFAVLKYSYQMQEEAVMKGFAGRINKGHVAPETSPS